MDSYNSQGSITSSTDFMSFFFFKQEKTVIAHFILNVLLYIYNIGLAKEFMQIFPYGVMEKP